MSAYPPGVTGLEPHLSGEWPCTGCGRILNDTTCCPCESCWTPHMDMQDPPDHCVRCCTSSDDQPEGDSQ